MAIIFPGRIAERPLDADLAVSCSYANSGVGIPCKGSKQKRLHAGVRWRLGRQEGNPWGQRRASGRDSNNDHPKRLPKVTHAYRFPQFGAGTTEIDPGQA